MNDHLKNFYSRLYQSSQRTQPLGEAHYQLCAKQLRGRWMRWLPADKNVRILDLGCGCGELLYFLRSLGYTHLYGIDACPEEIDRGRHMGLSTLICADAHDFLESPREKFDLIFALNFFEHLSKDRMVSFLDKVYQALVPRGKVLAVTPNGLSPFSGATRYWDFTHETCFTPASWRQLAAICGFQETRFEEYGPIPHSFPGVVRCGIWQGIRLFYTFLSTVEVGGDRDVSHVYTSDMKVILTK